MKKAIIALLMGVLLGGCAARVINTPAPMLDESGNPIDVSVALIGRRGVGHGCPVGGFIYTARHVMTDNKGEPIGAVYWSDREGNSGRAVLWARDEARDLAVLRIESGKTHTLEFADELKTGERVHWYEYDWEDKGVAFNPKLRWANSIGPPIAQHLRLDEDPAVGASGGCVLNDQNEVLGIVAWGMRLKSRELIGMAVSLLEDREVR
jgi:S1-C subfamily serine protease